MHSLPTGVEFFERGWLSSNNILIHDADRAILIDTGYWTHARQTYALVKSVIGDRQLTAICNTHLHSDHCGGNSYLQSCFPDVQTSVPPGHAAYIDNWDPETLTYSATGQHCPRFTRTGTLLDGDTFVVGNLTWQVHAAPGHDPHSVVIFNALHGILISADALWENGFGVVFPEIEGIAAFDEVESTIQLIENLCPKIVLPGHGAPFSDVSNAIGRARSRLSQFRSSPDKHASYAAKVLLKFKLLEIQKCSLPKFISWAQQVSYLNMLHAEYSNGTSFEQWMNDLCKSLEKSSACSIDGEYIININ
jgi:glyoxylase-like metal-dependent hydrolase (beta-lactamase superfamily II)